MNNLSFINGIGMTAGVGLDTRSPQLGEKPSDHFSGQKGFLPGRNTESEAEELGPLLDAIISDLPDEIKESLSEWTSQLVNGNRGTGEDVIGEEYILDGLEKILDEFIASVNASREVGQLESGQFLESNSLNIQAIADVVEHINKNLDAKPDLNQKPAVELLKDYVEGYTRISSHYGDASRYSPMEVIANISPEWRNVVMPEAGIQSLSLMGAHIAESLVETHREASQAPSRSESSMSTMMRQDMVLDKNMTHSIILRALEALNGEIQSSRETEFSLKIYPRSLGEVQISVTATREQLNIVVDSSAEAADKIKEDIIYFSKQYDNIKWRLNDNDLVKDQEEGDPPGNSDREMSGRLAFNENRIINIII